MLKENEYLNFLTAGYTLSDDNHEIGNGDANNDIAPYSLLYGNTQNGNFQIPFYKGYDIAEGNSKAEIMQCFLPHGNSREGKYQIPRYIIIHETSIGTEKAPEYKNMEYYKNKLFNDPNNEVAYHYLCSDKEIFQFMPDFEVAYHSGTKLNYRSIGIERLVNEKINFPEALHNQAKLTATLMYKWGIPLQRVITHKNARIAVEAQPKECPARMLDFQYGGEAAFYNEVIKCLRKKSFFYEVLNVSLAIMDDKPKRSR